MLNVNRPRVAVLRDDAGQHFVQRVATLDAAGFNVQAVTYDHGSGLNENVILPLAAGKLPPPDSVSGGTVRRSTRTAPEEDNVPTTPLHPW
jgi:hypothetical protein